LRFLYLSETFLGKEQKQMTKQGEVTIRDAEVLSAERIVERNKQRTEMHLAICLAVPTRARADRKWRSGAMRLAIR